MTRRLLGPLAAIVALLAPASATASLTLTRAGNPAAYALTGTDAGETADVTIVPVPVIGITVGADLAPVDAIYTFTSPQTIGGALPSGCVSSQAGQKVVCQDGADDADAATVTLDGGLGTDALSGATALTSGPAITLTGGEGSDTLTGGAGPELLNGSGDISDDVLTGGPGTDTYACVGASALIDVISYADGRAGPVSVDLADDAAPEPNADGETIPAGCEGVEGTPAPDTLTGDGVRNLLRGLDGADVIAGGDGPDSIVPGAGADTAVDGGPGADTLDLDDGRTTGVTVDLSDPAADAGDPGDRATAIENVHGTPFADRLTGSSEVNVLSGGNGDNFITGLGAPSGSGDLLSGGTDTSTLNCDDGRDHAAGVTVNLQAQVGCYPDDQVFGFTVVLGTDGPDDLGGTLGGQRLEGRGGDDILRGGSGDDVLVGGPGGDTLSGGLDSDTASYDDGRAAGVVVDLAAIPLGGDAGETATGIESVTGTPFADSLTGDAGVNVLDGRGGDDLLTGGAGGDGIDGGDGTDTTTCDDGAHGAGVTLTIGGAGCDSGETLSAVENAIGSSGPDTLTGDGLANRLDGRGGTDTIEGGAGDDTVIGGDGADTMTNTAGTDTLSYDDGRSVGVTVNLAAAPAVGGDAGDSATGFENLTGSPLDDLLTGTDGVNLIDGLGGPDQIDPGAGADAVAGGLGADTIHARDGVADSIDCGQQSDTLQADAADAAIDCETLDLPATLTPTPGATEAPGVTAAPTPTSTATADPAPAREPSLKSVFTVKRRSTKVKTLSLVDLPAGVSVTLACKPPKHAQHSCAFAKRTYPDVSAGTLSLKAPFKHRRLKPGTVITITFDTQTIKLKVRRNKPPKRS